MAEEQNQTPPEEYSPSSSFRATMDAIHAGERNPAVLRQTAVEKMSKESLGLEEGSPESKTEEGTGIGEGAEITEKPIGLPSEEPASEGVPERQDDDGEGEPEADDGEGLSRDDLRQKLSAEPEKLLAEDKKEDEKKEKEEWRGPQPADSNRFKARVDRYEKALTERDAALASIQKETQELKTKVEEYEKKGATLPLNVDEQLSELKQYRRRYALERDPEFQEKFAVRLNESNDLVDDAFSTVNVSEKLRTRIKEMGGVGAFLRSDTIVAVKAGKGQEDLKPADFVNRILAKMEAEAPDAAAVVRSELANQRKIEAEKGKFIQTETAEAEKYFSQIEQEESQIVAMEQQIEEKLNEVVTTFKGTVHSEDWMKPLEIPVDAQPDKHKLLSAENAFRKNLREFFDRQLDIPVVREAAKRATDQKQLNEFANILIDSARVFHVERELKKERDRANALATDLEKARKAGSRSTSRRTTGGKGVVDTSGEPKASDFSSALQFAITHDRWAKAQKGA